MRSLVNASLMLILGATSFGITTFAASATPASAPLGMVLQAEKAQVGADIISGGATIYDGDHLQTDTGGTLRVQIGGPQIFLRESSAAQVHRFPNGFSAELGMGTVVVSANPGQTFQLLADGATIRPLGAQGTVAQITKLSNTELVLSSTRGELEVTMGDEVKTVEAGSSYRMEVESEETGSPQPQGPYHTARNRFLWIIIPAISVATGILIWRALVSPDAPH